MSNKLDWMLDSGAYTAWRSKRPVDIQAYIQFIKAHEHTFPYVVCLDQIPGVFGRTPTSAQVEKAAEVSLTNFKIMQDALPEMAERLIPVYHQGEELQHLEHLVEAGAKYIGISPTNGVPPKQRLSWSRTVLATLPKDIKTHGFGFSTVHPEDAVFYSMDSSGWAQGGGYGWLLAPTSKDWKRVHVTDAHFAGTLERIEHIRNSAIAHGAKIPDALTVELLLSSGMARGIFNLLTQRAAVAPHKLYAPLLITRAIAAVRLWSPQYLLASYWFLRTPKSELMQALTSPQPSVDEVISNLTPRRLYNGKSKRRGKQATQSLPGLS